MSVTPSAARLTESLRDIGYDFPTAVADVVDNSVVAGAGRVEIEIRFDGADSWVSITDDGRGMSQALLMEALRYGTRRDYTRGDLGRYGLGLKTASLSQCRSVTVVSRAAGSARTSARMIDLDVVAEWDDWVVVTPGADAHVATARDSVADGGTVVLWRKLDRVLPEKRPEGGWARRRIEALTAKTVEHLGMVFHRFIEGVHGDRLTITVNGEKVRPWNPFASGEPARLELPPQEFEITIGEINGTVMFRGVVLPSRDQFSSVSEFERMSGPLNWNRQQGIYIYRANRLVQWGGWGGMRGIDEHTKLARAALDFDTDLDLAFNINVAKIRVMIPPQLRQMLEKPVNDLCIRADDAYRKTSRHAASMSQKVAIGAEPAELPLPPQREGVGSVTVLGAAGLALRAAAMHAGEYESWTRIADALRQQAPDIAGLLGLDV
jgi:anti-sigma regulatory factor (Ser/Thr protein kinase)